MELNELTQLISIREYTYAALNNASIDRKVIKELNGILILLDRKIINILRSEQFKDYVGYEDVEEAVQNVRKLNDIRSGLKK